MKQLLDILRAFAALFVAGAAAVLLFTVLGSLLIAVGVFIAAIVVAGGIYALVTGRRAFVFRRATFEDVVVREPGAFHVREADLIDVTPPRDKRRP